ncbi:uncharacterized protein LOC143188240 isoform X2 [Calliopsis andreniformis]|uniref:uncharacterized protein LOC143188240 isoform X2 n=1 Tax=Calliopsis andreniformis TaxID=337506 RepID=UPI003FCEA1D6
MTNISKDYEKLNDVSNCFTEETLRNILCSEHKGKNADILSWDFGESTTVGENYLSTVNKIKVTGIVDGKQVETKIVVKSLPKNLGRRRTYRSTDFFRNEIQFYTKVVPKFERFLEDKGQSRILCIPRHLASVMDGENDYIALENVCSRGYESMFRQDSISKDQSVMILKATAKFHAISFAYKDQRKEEFKEIIDNLEETYFSKTHWPWYQRFHENLVDITKNALETEYPGSEAKKRYNSYKPGELYFKVSEFCERKYYPTSVINQGDSWLPNFMCNRQNGNDILILDFQLARCVSPVLDVSTCIYGCADKSIWHEHFDELLKLYYNELSNTIILLGSDPENVYSWSTFMNEVKEQFVTGIVFAMEIVPFSLLESDAFDLDAIIKDDNAVNIADIWTLSNIKTQQGRLRLANTIVHAVEKEFI